MWHGEAKRPRNAKQRVDFSLLMASGHLIKTDRAGDVWPKRDVSLLRSTDG